VGYWIPTNYFLSDPEVLLEFGAGVTEHCQTLVPFASLKTDLGKEGS